MLGPPSRCPPRGSRKNTSWQGPLQHRLCLSMEKDPSLSSPMYCLRSDSPHQWSEHGLGTTSAGLWVTHNNDPITIPSLPPPLLISVSDDRVKGANCPHRWRHMARTALDASHTFSRKNQSTSSTRYDKRSGRPTTSFNGRPSR